MLINGSPVANYRIDGVLGAGAMSIVYRAIAPDGTTVALKVLADELSGDPWFRARFEREARVQRTFVHPHMVPLLDFGETEAGMYIVMPVIEGPTLKSLLATSRVDAWRSLRLLLQVAEALDAAKARDLVHRDVKPQNILVGPGDHAYLVDFGFVTAGMGAPLTQTGQVLGTIDYLSPEQARSELVTGSSDVYGLACVLCEALTGNVPFPRTSPPATIFAHLTEPPPRVSERRPDLPRALDQVLARGMAKDPADRPTSAVELVELAADALRSAQEASAGPSLTHPAVIE
jgi:serine/threonine-protein kinase